MNILHINQSDISGGAAIAAYRLHQGLLAREIDSRLLVETMSSDSDRVKQIARKRFTEDITSRGASFLGLNYINLFSTFSIPQDPSFQNADIVNFHNLHGNYFNYLALPKLTNQKIAVLTLHDMWSFTGHCSYSYDCERWKSGCGKCPSLETYPSVTRDSTWLEWKLKRWIYDRSKVAIITPSLWLKETVQHSMLKHFPVYHIPNGVDTDAYKPIDSELARSLLEIPLNKKVLMFGAQSLTELRKGGDLLRKILCELPTNIKKDTVLLTIGNGGEAISKVVDMPVINLGYISGDRLKAVAYSAADVFLFPSRADNFPLTLLESISCGTPIVSFNVGGVVELVRSGQTGFFAEAENTREFTNNIIQVLERIKDCDEINQLCRALALSEYSLDLQAKRYINLYTELLNTK